MAAFLASMSNTELLEICQKWAQKKQQIFFGFTALCAAAGRRLFSFYSGSVWQTGIYMAFQIKQKANTHPHALPVFFFTINIP